MNKLAIELDLEKNYCLGKCPKAAECNSHCNLFNQILNGMIAKERKNGNYEED